MHNLYIHSYIVNLYDTEDHMAYRMRPHLEAPFYRLLIALDFSILAVEYPILATEYAKELSAELKQARETAQKSIRKTQAEHAKVCMHIQYINV